MRQNLLKEDELDIKNNPQKAKKRLIIVILSIIGVIALLGVVSVIIDLFEKEEEFEVDYNFYPANFDENIFENAAYLELISSEFITYTDSSTGITVGIDQNRAGEYGAGVKFLVDMIYDIINGDNTAYNERFSEEYYKKHSPKDKFTMQKVYDVNITYISSETVKEDSGDYTKIIYTLEYKIFENNGTFRRDIGAGSKKQYFSLKVTEHRILVDSVTTINVAKK